MDLFNQKSKIINLLTKDGTVEYYGVVFNKKEADNYFSELMNSIKWKNDEAIIFGKLITTKRKVAWYAEKEFSYTYSKITKTSLLFTDVLLDIKNRVQELTGETYNSCLLNLYHNGLEGMNWHSDGEKDLKKHGAIASVSFGAERKFGFKHKETKETIWKYLPNGSLLVMKDETQDHWLHRLPPTKKVNKPRINLTFRTISG